VVTFENYIFFNAFFSHWLTCVGNLLEKIQIAIINNCLPCKKNQLMFLPLDINDDNIS